MPNLTPDEVERYVALGKAGKDLLKTGDLQRAEIAFRQQAAMFPPNPEPFVALALLEAGRGNDDAAVDHLRDAVARGFTDLRSIVRAEAWTGVGRPTGFLKLLDALPEIEELERDWPEWTTLPEVRAPRSFEDVQARHIELKARIDAMAPALGDRLHRLWHRTIERSTAWHLEAYLAHRPESDDFEPALERLVAFFAGGPLRSWQRHPAELSKRMIHTSKLVTDRYPDSDMRATALVALAAGKNAVRDPKGRLHPIAAAEIRQALGEVVADPAASGPLHATAVVGLVRTELDTGRPDRAEALYREFREAHAADRDLAGRVQEELGELALRVGGLPEFRVQTLEGRTLDRGSLSGKVAVVDFWATWCGPCLEELPSLRRLVAKHGDDVVVVGINLDDPEEVPPGGLLDWVTRQGVPGDQVHDGLGWESELVRAFGVKEIPFNVVVGPAGDVLAVNQQGKRLEKTVRAALREVPTVSTAAAR